MKLTWRVWLLIFFLVISIMSIFGLPPKFLQTGVVITSVQHNSTSFESGLRQGQIITSVDGNEIKTLEDFSNSLSGKFLSGEKVKTIINTDDGEVILFSDSLPEITVSAIPKTNIETGLDLAGGSRALIRAENHDLTSSELKDLIDVVSNRLNVYGITDLNIVPVKDLSGNNFMLIEIAGATPSDLENLISQQGKFEAKIGNQTVFEGGNKDITSVCRNNAACSVLENPQPTSGGYYSNFRFSIYLSEEAAERHAEITENIPVNSTPQGNYLTEKLDLFVDDQLLDSLSISEGLKGRAETQISISGSGSGTTPQEAIESAQENMNKLQTILITGSFPFKLEIVKLDTISPLLGKEFTNSIFIAGLAAILMVSVIIFFRYKRIKSSLALILTTVSEVVIILGVASFIHWNLDLPSIAGILATIGTGIDDLVVLLDESQFGRTFSLKQRIKSAFAIILGAYFTSLVSLLPLLWAGAGLLKGFAITTIIGISVGVFITRPAFSDIMPKEE